MKLLSQLTLLVTFVITLNACNNDFLDEVPFDPDLAFGQSAIYISPEWDEDDYWFSCPIARSTEFTIEETPDWLQIENMTGSLTYSSTSWVEPNPQSKGTIRARATVNPDFAKVGIYIDYMTVKANNKSYRVPVYYISEGDPVVSVVESIEFSYADFTDMHVEIQNRGEGILLWEVVSMPDWLDLDTLNLRADGVILARDRSYQIPLKITINPDVSTNEYEGDIVLRTNDKENELVTVHVTADLGNPVFNLSGAYNNLIDFGTNRTTYSMSLYNQGSGLLVWQFSNLPDWLKMSKSSGTLKSYYTETLEFYIDDNYLQPGWNRDTILLSTNDPNKRAVSILVTARGNGNNALTYPIEGNIVDAAFIKSTNTLVYATSQPNKLLFYDADTKIITHEIALSKAPTCFTFSEDYSLAAVGHTGLISTIDLNNYSLSKQILVSQQVYDITWADSTLFCYTEQTSYSDYIYWIDVKSGAMKVLTTNDVDGKTKIKKVPTKPFLLASRQQSSPSGFITYSIVNQSLQSYSHKSLSDYWFTDDGEYTITRIGEVYRTSSMTDATDTFHANISPIDLLSDTGGSTSYSPVWADHSKYTGKLFTVKYDYFSQNTICRFDDIDFTLEKTYLCDDLYQLNTQTAAFEVKAHYVFANREGTELLVLRKGKDNNYWSLEYIER